MTALLDTSPLYAAMARTVDAYHLRPPLAVGIASAFSCAAIAAYNRPRSRLPVLILFD